MAMKVAVARELRAGTLAAGMSDFIASCYRGPSLRARVAFLPNLRWHRKSRRMILKEYQKRAVATVVEFVEALAYWRREDRGQPFRPEKPVEALWPRR